MSAQSLDQLRRARPRSRLVPWSAAALAGLCAYAWGSGELAAGALFEGRRLEGLARFVTVELVPAPLRGRPFEPAALLGWLGELLVERGLPAAGRTLAIALVAMALATLLAAALGPLAARNVAAPDPFGAAGAGSARARFGWGLLRLAARAASSLFRAVPEYLLAFLLLVVLGPRTAWPAVLALALHNGAILARLGAEVVEDLEPAPLRALAALGARRLEVLGAAAAPLAVGRWLAFAFYRLETCLREATALGMLGILSLGYWLQDARAKLYYDEMLVYVALGSLLVIAADLASALARRYLRADS